MLKTFYAITCSMVLLLIRMISSAQSKDEPIEIKSLSIEIHSNSFSAVTTMSMEFYNPNLKVLDGEYNFSLNAGQVINGFALDINGFLREGVITDKQKGRIAYENTISRRVDPGLLEMTTDNNYRVRIYPMPAKGTRKIKIAIAQLLSIQYNSLQYSLPLDIPYTVRQLTVNAFHSGLLQSPDITGGLLMKSSFNRKGDEYILNYTQRNAELKKPLLFQIPLPLTGISICRKITDSTALFAVHSKPEIQTTVDSSHSPITVFWDVSSSASKRNSKKDIHFLENFIKQRNITNLTIVTFSNTVHESKTFHGASLINAVKRFLKTQAFDGGTQLGSINCNQFDADMFFLFSDGMNNFRSDKLKTNNKPVHCINSSPVSNQSFLKKIAATTGGRFIDLYNTNLAQAVIEFNSPVKRLLGVKTKQESLLSNISLPIVFTDWVSVIGEIRSGDDSLILSYGDNGKVMKEESVFIGKESNCSIGLADTLQALSFYQYLTDKEHEKALQKFAANRKIVSKFTSFIVLDNLSDYIQYGIEPPSDLHAEYQKLKDVVRLQKENLKQEEANAEINNLLKAITLYNERISWWQKGEPLIALSVLEKKNYDTIKVKATTENNTPNVNTENDGTADAFKFGNTALNEVVVTAYSMQNRRTVTGSITTIRSSELNTSTTVQQALQGRVAGVTVTNNNGLPGSVQRVYIRGSQSLGSGKEPLYILDGFPIDGETAATLDVNTIESISVIKDAQAGMLYGSRAANGAIVITTRRTFRNSNQYKQGIAKYKDLEDVEYVTELNDSGREKLYERYLQMKDSMGKDPAFFFDAAQLLFENGDKEKALRVLTNLAEVNSENHQLLRGLGYVLETWGMYDEAIDVYKRVLQIKEEEPQSYRDLALAYERKGDKQKAINLLYSSLTKNWFQYENRYRGLKSLLLNEMNAIINRNQKNLDLSKINGGIIRPLPVDLRIVVDWNKDETDIDLHIVEPGNEECNYSNRTTKSGGRLSEDFTQGYGPEEYQIKDAKKGKYSIRVNYYGDRYQKEQVPSFVRLTIYKNFGKPNQSVTTETLVMDHQQGIVEIGEVKW